MNINFQNQLSELKQKRANLERIAREDEGVAEHYAELSSVIEAIESGLSDDEVLKAAEWVGVTL